ncbi:MAG: cytochrome b [Gammaproteobacteria bacterium]|nr:cytochrome b [Gammaproteobacteria bacterium]
MPDNKEILVWDILVRLFHWFLVISFVVAYLTAEESEQWHAYFGYAVMGLISFRMVWGVIGSKYARFRDFVYSPRAVYRYLKILLAKQPEYYIGHNPAGGWMIVALLISLFVVTVSGLKLYAIEEGRGPLAGGAADEITVISAAYADEVRDEKSTGRERGRGRPRHKENIWEEVHEVSANLMLLLIFLHVAGVIVSSRLHHENLVKAMITGKKKVLPDA